MVIIIKKSLNRKSNYCGGEGVTVGQLGVSWDCIHFISLIWPEHFLLIVFLF